MDILKRARNTLFKSNVIGKRSNSSLLKKKGRRIFKLWGEMVTLLEDIGGEVGQCDRPKNLLLLLMEVRYLFFHRVRETGPYLY